jgi:hypothetical protein
VSLDVCTPPQIESIANSLVHRLAHPSDYQTCFAVARLYHILSTSETRKLELWREGYNLMMKSTGSQSEIEANWMKKIVECEIECCGYNARETLGSQFSYPVVEHNSLDHRFLFLRMFQGPVSFGPMGQTLSFLSETLCQEQLLSCGSDAESLRNLVCFEREQSLERYQFQLNIIDDFTRSYDIDVPVTLKEREKSLLDAIFRPVVLGVGLSEEVTLFMEEFYSLGVQMRLDRLYKVADKVREQASPPVFDRAPHAIRQAYFTFRRNFAPNEGSADVDERWKRHCREDAAQDALMILAMNKWNPEVCREPTWRMQLCQLP